MRLAARRVGRAFPDEHAPLALTAPERGVPRLTAVGQTAAALGLVPGMALADARAACPDLLVRQAEPAADAEELAAKVYGGDADALGRAERGNGAMAVYRRGKGAVFNAGSCEWVAGLIARGSPVETVTRNLLLGVWG